MGDVIDFASARSKRMESRPEQERELGKAFERWGDLLRGAITSRDYERALFCALSAVSEARGVALLAGWARMKGYKPGWLHYACQNLLGLATVPEVIPERPETAWFMDVLAGYVRSCAKDGARLTQRVAHELHVMAALNHASGAGKPYGVKVALSREDMGALRDLLRENWVWNRAGSLECVTGLDDVDLWELVIATAKSMKWQIVSDSSGVGESIAGERVNEEVSR